MCSLLMQAAPQLSSRAAVSNGWRSPAPADAKLGKLLGHAHGDVSPPADDACGSGALGRAESAMSAETAYYDAGCPLQLTCQFHALLRLLLRRARVYASRRA